MDTTAASSTLRRAQRGSRGVALIETILALGIGAALMVGGAYSIQERTGDIREKGAAEYLKTVTQAADNWMRDNFAQIASDARAAPRAYNAATIASYLPPGFTTNPYGETFSILTRPTVRGGVELLVVTGSGTRVPEPRRLAAAAALAGPTSGFFAQAGQGALQCGGSQICGSFGGWRTTTAGFATPTVTRPTMASILNMDNGTVNADYLYRNEVPGSPELNRMNTAIDMAGFDINNTGTYRGANGELTGTLNVAGNIASTAGAVTSFQGMRSCAGDASGCGVTVSNDGGFYDYNNGNITFVGNPNIAGSGLRIASSSSNGNGSNLMVDGSISSRQGLTTCQADGTGCGITVSNDGGFYDLNNGWITMRGNQAGGGLTIDGVGNNLRVTGDATINRGLTVNGNQIVNGTFSSQTTNIYGTMTAMGNVLITRHQTPGGSCHPNTSNLARVASSGNLLVCTLGTTGTWTWVEFRAPKQYTLTVWRGADDSNAIQAPTCPSGYTLLDWEPISSYDNWTTLGLCER